jgi:hypothetical protein
MKLVTRGRTALFFGLALALCLSIAAPALAWEIKGLTVSATNADGSIETRAGAHPDELTIDLAFDTKVDGNGVMGPVENVKDLWVDLPRGLIGDPSVVGQCTQPELDVGGCPPDSQLGVVDIVQATGPPREVMIVRAGLFNLVPRSGAPAEFGFQSGVGAVVSRSSVRTGGDYGLSFNLRDLLQPTAVVATKITLWGTPADPSHDALRGSYCFIIPGFGEFCPGPGGASSGLLPRPFLTMPADCSAGPMVTTAWATSWQSPEDRQTRSYSSQLADGTPVGVTECERLVFDASLEARPEGQPNAGAPAPYVVDLDVPQNDNPDGLATPPLRKAEVTLPEGTTINPSAAAGLGACTSAQIALDSPARHTCPASSRIGDVTLHTPLLKEPMEGAVYLATPHDNPAATLVALYIAIEGSGVRVKLPGSVALDPQTGRLKATFDNNPQLPFSELKLRFRGGSRAPLANPSRCGTYTTHGEFTPWSSSTPVVSEDSFAVDGNCDAAGRFEPVLGAGLASPVAGGSSAFVMDLERPDGQQNLSGIEVSMPPGLLAKLAGVPLCGHSAAASGACDETSRVGKAIAAVGAGELPLWLPEPGKAPTAVYLAGPYKGAPYSLVVKVPAQAGPFDLGTVVVRAALFIDPEDAQVRVVADPLPQILEGIPQRYRTVHVDIDRAGFIKAPTSCEEMPIGGRITSDTGTVANVGARFQVGDCAALRFTPKLSARLTGKGRTRLGAHPALKTVLTQPKGQAGIGRATVTLPKSLALDSRNTAGTTRVCDYDASLKADCPANTVVGQARAVTPLLGKPLAGPVHLVQGIRFGPTGNRQRTTPSLLVKLRGEVAINLRARTTVRGGRLVTVFPKVPDAPISKFALRIDGGDDGILVVTRTPGGSICARRQTAGVKLAGHNGRTASYPVRVKTPCRKR